MTIRKLMGKKEFHSVLAHSVFQQHGVEAWTNANVSVLFMKETATENILQVRVEITYSPVDKSAK